MYRALVALMFLQAAARTGRAQQTSQVLSSHVPAAVSSNQAALVSAKSLNDQMNVSIVLPLRNQAELTDLLRRLYDPSSPDYHRFLSVAEFTDRFGPTPQDYQAVVSFARSHRLEVTGAPANRLVVPVMGSVDAINSAFHVSMNVYQHPTEGRTFFSPDREPSLDLNVHVAHVSGLNNFSLPKPMLVQSDATPAVVTGSGPGGSYLSSDMRAAYYGGTTLTGAGQTVGLLEFSGYNQSDVDLTFSNAGQTYSVPITTELLDGAIGTGGSGGAEAEVVLDIVQAIGMAPGLDGVKVYIGTGPDDAHILNAMASENIAKQLSGSWSWRPDDPQVDDVFFEEMAAQGQSYFTASGDSGAFYYPVSPFFYPQEDAYVTAVGGTHLVTNGAAGTYSSETAWHTGAGGSGGGISPDNIPIPSWQSGVANSANGGSTTLRNVPDVAMEADFDNYVCSLGRCSGTWAGTSFAAPRWAGFMSLVNQQAVEAGTAPSGGIGFINPLIYQIAAGADYGTDLHDVTSGNNDTSTQPIWYNAVTGYDLVTGWGSASGQSLIDALAGPQVPGFWIQSSSSNIAVSLGTSSSATITISDAGGFNGNVDLSLSALPTGVTASWSQNPASATSVLTLTASDSAPPSTSNLTITGGSGTLSATTNVTVSVHAPTFLLTALPSSVSVNQGSSGTSTITVTPQYGFSGSVNLAISGLPAGVTATLGTNPTSATSLLTLNVSNSITPGTYTLTVTGTSGSLTVTSTVILNVHGPSFTLSAYGPVSVGQGSSATAYVYVNPVYGFNGNVNLAVSGLPSGVTASFTPNPATGSSTLTLTAASSANIGSTTLTITGTSGSLTASTTLTVAVFAPTFTLSTSSTVTVGEGTTGSASVYIYGQYGFNNNVTLTVSGLPAGVIALWSPNPTTGSSTLTLAVSNSVAVGQYLLMITGVSGSITQTAALTLSVKAPTFTLSTGIANLGQGHSANTYVNVYAQYGFTGSVNLSVTGLPSGVTASFSPNPTTYSSTLTLTASSSAAVGQYPLTITGTSGSQTVTTTMTLGIYVPSFTLNGPGTVNIGQGTTATTYTYVNSQYGFTGSVNLSISGLPSGVTASFSPNPTTYSSTLALTATSTAALGQYTVTITGTSGSQTATTTFTVGVYTPTFTISSGTSLSIGQGYSGTAYLYLYSQYGFNGSVNFSISGLPSGVTASFSPNPTTYSSTLTLTASSTAALGQYTVTITGTSGSQTATTTMPVAIYAPAFTISTYSSPTIGQGASGSAYVNVNAQYGFNGAVNFSITGLPSGVTASFSPNPATGSTVLTLAASSAAAAGQYALTITGTSGSLAASTTMNVTISPQSFTFYGSPSSITLNQGASTTSYLYITPQFGFNSGVTFGVAGLPAGVTAVFSPNPATSSSLLTLTASGAATPGPATLTVTGTSGSLAATATLTLTVNASTFTLLDAPSEITLLAGQSESSTVSIVPLNGFTGAVNLTISGLPSGVTATISPNPVTSSSTLHLVASQSAGPGSANATITGTLGSLSVTTPLAVTVKGPPPTTSTSLAITSGGNSVTSVASGTAVTLMAGVTANSSKLTTGQVLFCDTTTASSCGNSSAIGEAQLTSVGLAAWTYIPGPGVHSYTAQFVGLSSEAASSSAASGLTVSGSQSTTTSIAQSGLAGQYSLTATITGMGAIAPTGNISFVDTTAGNSQIASAVLVPGTPSLALGTSQWSMTGVQAQAVATGDFNGDGRPDLAVISNSSVTILLNNGDGTFSGSVPTLPTGQSTVAIVAADFNSDDKLDLAVVNSSSGSVNVFLGNGDGTFTPNQLSPKTGSYPQAIALGDFNGDGRPDLAVANSSSNSVTILLGNGDGTFTATASSPQTGSSPASLAIGDFNGDGVQDIAVASNYYAGTITILLGNGDGTFSTGIAPSVSNYPRSIVVGDFNKDGVQDLAVANYYGASVTILLGKGDGTFTATASVPHTGTYPQAIVVADLNADGIPDLAVANNGSNNITTLLGKGDGTFTAGVTPTTPLEPIALAVADFNGDSVSDFAVASSYVSTVSTMNLQLSQIAKATANGVSPAGSGSHLVDASYAGDSGYAGSTSSTVQLTAQAAAPTVSLGLSASNITIAQTLTVTVGVAGPSGYPVPTGSVKVTNGSYSSAVTSLAGGSALIAIPPGSLPVGTDALTVSYTPDAGSSSTYNNSSASDSVVVTQAVPAVSVIPSPSGITTIQSASITVTVAGGAGTPTATGSVTLSSGRYTSAAATLSNGSATIVIPDGSLGLGTNIITANYTPDTAGAAIYNAAFGATSVTVTKATPSVTVTPSLSTPTTTQALTVTVSVSGGGASPVATGSVMLAGGGYTSSAATLNNGSATIPVPAESLQVGTDVLSVSYSPDASAAAIYTAGSGTSAVTVSKTPLAVSVTPSASSITTLQGLSVAVSISGGSGTPVPTGSVTLTSGSYSNQQTLIAGSASFSLAAGTLPLGTDTLSAAFTPDSASAGIYSTAIKTANVAVTPPIGNASSTITASVSAGTITNLQTDTVTIAVSGGTGQPVPSGTVTLSSGTYSAQQALGSGSVSFTVPAGSLASGTDTLTASYSGDPTYATNSATATITIAPVVATASTPASINAGATGSATITFTSGSTYSGTLNLSCTLMNSPAGAQSLPSCTMSPGNIVLTNGGTGTASVAMTTTAGSSASLQMPFRSQPWGIYGGTTLAFAIFLGTPRRRRWTGLLLLLCAVAGIGGCGSGSGMGSTYTSTPATTAGTYVFSVSGADAANPNIKTSNTITLTVL
jgi:hypothetical protein